MRMPVMRLRVVCGLGETMATFSPRIWLSNVDLPTLGRPIMAIVPERKGGAFFFLFLFSGSAINQNRAKTYYDIAEPPFKVKSGSPIPVMPIRLTAPMKRRLTRRALEMIENSLKHFPELQDTTITVGYTRKHLGSATILYRKGIITRLIIRLRVRKVTYQTIGHELTHLIQGLAHGGRSRSRSADPAKVPSGEQQCDIWTLARDPLFCDDPPTYIKMPRSIRERWPEYADQVRHLCIAAITKRHTHRFYIRWLEQELRNLAKKARAKNREAQQLLLPFVI